MMNRYAVVLAVAVLAGCASKPSVVPAPEPSLEVDRETLATFVKSRKAELKACYQSQLKLHPPLEGTVAVQFTIAIPAAQATCSSSTTRWATRRWAPA